MTDRWWVSSRVVPAVGLVLAIAAAIGASVTVDHVVRDQERRLLSERGGEVALLLNVSITATQSSLPVLATVSRLQGRSSKAFAQAARPLLSPGVRTVGVARSRGGVFRIQDAVGRGPGAGRALDAARSALARRALRGRRVVGDGAQLYGFATEDLPRYPQVAALAAASLTQHLPLTPLYLRRPDAVPQA